MSPPSSPALQRLDLLNGPSPDFHNQLSNVLCGEEYRRSVLDLQGDDLVWLVDYLDKVRSHVNFPHPPFKPAQALDALNPSSAASQKCLHELRSICGDRGILPTSYTRSSHLLGIGPNPFASGGYGDVYEGSLDGLRVCIKRVRVYAHDGLQKATKVRFRCRRFSCSPSLIQLADLLPRSRNMETVDTPEHLTLAGHHYRSPPTHFGLDVRW